MTNIILILFYIGVFLLTSLIIYNSKKGTLGIKFKKYSDSESLIDLFYFI